MENLDREIFSLLLDACRDGDLERIKKYLNKNNIEGTDSYTPLMATISSRKYNILDYLLSQGANPNRMLPLYLEGMCNDYLPVVHKDSTYLHYAIFKEVEDFEFQNSDILFGNTKIKEMYIPIELLKILYKYGADINKMNEKGETPLDMAICKHHHTAEEYLKSIGAKTSKELEENK